MGTEHLLPILKDHKCEKKTDNGPSFRREKGEQAI